MAAASALPHVLTLRYSGRTAYSDEHQLQLQVLLDVVKLRLGATLARGPGQDVSLSVSGALSDLPYDSYFIELTLSAAPAHAEPLFAVLLGEIESMKQGGGEPAELGLALQRRLEVRRRVLRLAEAADLGAYQEQVDALTADQLRQAALRYFGMEQRHHPIHTLPPRQRVVEPARH